MNNSVVSLFMLAGCVAPASQDTAQGQNYEFGASPPFSYVGTIPGSRTDVQAHYFFIPIDSSGEECRTAAKEDIAKYSLPVTDFSFSITRESEPGLNGDVYHNYSTLEALFYEPLGEVVSSPTTPSEREYAVLAPLLQYQEFTAFAIEKKARPEISLYTCE